MEHAEIIAGAYTFTKNAFFSINHLPRWIVLFFYIVGPIIVGFIAATIVLQLIVLPILVNLLVGPDFGFTPEVLSGLLGHFAVLIGLACVLFVPLMQGYCYRLFRTGDTMPDTGNLWGLFFNGWRINITLFIYAIPLMVISFIYMLVFMYFFPDTGLYSAADVLQLEGMMYVGTVFSYAAIQFVTTLIIILFACVGITHLCRTGSIREAISLRKVAEIIGKIGWYDYILSLVIMSILYLMITFVTMSLGQLFSNNVFLIGVLMVLYIFVLVPITVFFIKYLSIVYDTAFQPEEADTEEFDFF
ncbi:DUF4013 domain-containing protein [Methanorbis rubei]|uniref:DUF4013 domain-containing protein n=1 Tax=Methanorbis rubei TaxID=3028300 RepID=A0AAE4SCW0_9EURY|nr:hypothetical protein [Methanocorpusculaceae archaeon Cs1]